jgi:hypothetical protein
MTIRILSKKNGKKRWENDGEKKIDPQFLSK